MEGDKHSVISIPPVVGTEPVELEEQMENNAGKTTFFKTCFNTINILSGIGMLSMPYAVAAGGWWSLIFLLIFAISTTYTGLLIKRCMDLCPNARTYHDIGEVAFGRRGRFLVSVFVNMELYMCATIFLIMLGDNLHKLFPGLHIAGTSIEGKQMFTVIVALAILPTVLLKNISFLSYVSATGVLASIMIIASVFWVGAFDGVGFHQTVKPIKWTGLPRAVSLYAATYSAHPLFPTFYTSMRKKKQFPKVLTVSFVISTAMSVLMAVIGCLMFGSKVQSQITLNLPIEKISSKVAIYTTLVNPIAKYSLIVTPIVHDIENRLPSKYNKTWISMLVRINMVVSTVVVALLFPSFIDLFSLVGAFLMVTTCSILPCVCYLKISGIYRKFGLEQGVIGGILAMSIIVAIVGTCDSVLAITKLF